MDCKGNNQVSVLSKIESKINIERIINLRLKYRINDEVSFNLLLYKFFDMPNSDLHNELYGLLTDLIKNQDTYKKNQGEEKNMKRFFKNNSFDDQSKVYRQEKSDGSISERKLPIPIYIRNIIHHPENDLNSGFKKQELRDSIDQMLELVNFI